LQSEHPLAEAVTASIHANGGQRISFDKFESITGKGVAAKNMDNHYLVGNQKLLTDYKFNFSDESLFSIK